MHSFAIDVTLIFFFCCLLLFQFDIYTKTLLKAIDLLLTVISKWEFCKESAKAVKDIITSPNHCIYINDTISTLFEYMVYDFDGKYN